MRYLADLNRRFWAAGRKGAPLEMEALAVEGFAAGIRPLDMLFGFAGPQLVTVGRRWEANLLTVCEEHRFTEACEALVDLIERHIQAAALSAPAPNAPTILIAAVPGNMHMLGLRFASLGFESMGVRTTVLGYGFSPQAIVDAALSERCTAVGLSISMPSQTPALRVLLDAFARPPAFTGPILVGGAAVNAGLVPAAAALGARVVPHLRFDAAEWPALTAGYSTLSS